MAYSPNITTWSFDPLSMSEPSDKLVMIYVIQLELFSPNQNII